MSFRQDLPGFGEPAEGSWDAWGRINTEKKNGGMIGVFRQGAREKSRTVTVAGLMPDRKYSVLLAPGGKQIAVLTGIQLTEQGFSVDFKNEYEGNVYEVRETE
jgi:alpha-galactosidase